MTPTTLEELFADVQVSLEYASVALQDLRPFMSDAQWSVLKDNIKNCEEKDYFREMVVALHGRVERMPKTYDQDGMGDKAVVHLHYFVGSCDWWITEKDKSGGLQHQAFGLACLGHEPELGYISIKELTDVGAELDLHWTPKTLGEIRAKLYG